MAAFKHLRAQEFSAQVLWIDSGPIKRFARVKFETENGHKCRAAPDDGSYAVDITGFGRGRGRGGCGLSFFCAASYSRLVYTCTRRRGVRRIANVKDERLSCQSHPCETVETSSSSRAGVSSIRSTKKKERVRGKEGTPYPGMSHKNSG